MAPIPNGLTDAEILANMRAQKRVLEALGKQILSSNGTRQARLNGVARVLRLEYKVLKAAWRRRCAVRQMEEWP